jgi:hypothetical protein
MRTLILTLMVCISLKAIAQNQNLSYSKACILNFSNSSSQYKEATSNDTLPNHWRLNFNTTNQAIKPSFGIQFMLKSNNTFEIELSSFMIAKKSTDLYMVQDSTNANTFIRKYETKTTDISIKAEYQYTFFKNKNYKLVPSVGTSFMPFYQTFQLSPSQNTNFDISETKAGMQICIVPRLNYHFSKYFVLMAGCNMNFARFEIRNTKSSNPKIAPANRSVSTFDFNSIDGLSYRLGIAYKL